MGSSEWSFRGEEVEVEKIKEFCPEEGKTFYNLLEELDMGDREYAQRIAYGEDHLDVDSEDLKRLDDAYEVVVDAFYDKTSVQVSLDTPSGDHRESQSRGYWVVENHYIVNPNISLESLGLIDDFDVICGG